MRRLQKHGAGRQERAAPDPPFVSERRYFAFLSYSHRDEALATWLHKELERFQVPPTLAGRLTPNGVIPRRLRPIFRDAQELGAADDLGEEIEHAIASSQYLIVLCSPDAARSRWTNAEVEAFKRSRPEGCIFAAIAAGEPFASESAEQKDQECFPPALRVRFDRRGRPTTKRAEPLAADLRGNDEQRRVGLLKLIAGMLGVGLDELMQRHATRRQRRLALITSASIIGMALTTTLAIVAIQARDSARDQRREAEGLVAFMLGDLKDKLEPIGRLDALDGVGARVLAYYSKQDTSDLSDAALLQRARALSLTAQVAFLRGDYRAASRLFREALAGTSEAVERDPADPQRLFEHAQNVFWTGDLARRQGRIAEAEAAYRQYGALAARMVALEPDNLKWRMEAQYARENLGIVLMAQRRFGEAARHFAGALGPVQSLAALDPTKAEYQKEVGNLLAWLADARRAEGRPEEAIGLRRQQIAHLEKRIAEDGADVSYRQQIVPARRALGLLLEASNPTESIRQFRAALAAADQLIAIEPDNSVWRGMAAGVRFDLAKALVGTGQRDEAGRQIIAGCAIADRLRATNPAVSRWQALQTACFSAQARLALASGNSGEAVIHAQRAVQSARAERSGDGIADRFAIATALAVLGDARARSGDLAGARAAWSEGLAQLPDGVAERPSEVAERNGLLRRLGRAPESRS